MVKKQFSMGDLEKRRPWLDGQRWDRKSLAAEGASCREASITACGHL